MPRRRTTSTKKKTSRRKTATKRKRSTKSTRTKSSRWRYDRQGDVIMGYGKYSMRRGALPSAATPRVQNTELGVIVRHQEFIADVPSSIPFALATLPLNPGMSQTFPWLSRLAQNFEEWLPRGIVFEYRTTSSDTLLAANPALGSIVLATQYNSVSPTFVTKQQMENYQGSISCKPSVSMLHQVECKRSQTVMDELYIRSGPPPPDADLRLYDLGKTSVATVGSQTTGNLVGELWVSYEVELRKPKIPDDPQVLAAHFQLSAAAIAGDSPARMFGTTAGIAGQTLPTVGSTMQEARVGNLTASGTPQNNTIVFGPRARGNFLLVGHHPWTTPGSQGAVTLTATGCTILQLWSNNTLLLDQEVDAATATAATTNWAAVINITAADANLVVASSSTATGGYLVGGDLWITELPDGM